MWTHILEGYISYTPILMEFYATLPLFQRLAPNFGWLDPDVFTTLDPCNRCCPRLLAAREINYIPSLSVDAVERAMLYAAILVAGEGSGYLTTSYPMPLTIALSW